MAFIKLPHPGRVYIPTPRIPVGGATRLNWKVKVRMHERGHRMNNFMLKWKRNFLYRSGGALRTWIIKSFKRRAKKTTHSPVDTPPYLHQVKAAFINGAIQFAVSVDRGETIVGVSWRKAKKWGKMHEHGGMWPERKSRKGGSRMVMYPARPFVEPAGIRWMMANRHVKSGAASLLRETREQAYKGF